MKIMAFSDLHLAQGRAAALVEASHEADLVIGAGDFCNQRRGLEKAMEMLAGLAAPFIAVPGNAESRDELRQAADPATQVLHGEGTDFQGLNVFGLGYGVPRTPFGDWSCDLTEAEAEAQLSCCEACDVLVLHSPPKGVVDRTSDGTSVGSVALREAIQRIQPALAICGHIHDSWGQEGSIGQTRVVNLGPHPNWFELTGA
ncbi:MAG: metallophosphoesterase family protein [Pseudomonadota bacterium]